MRNMYSTTCSRRCMLAVEALEDRWTPGFSGPIQYYGSATTPVVGDFNNDGILDIATSRSWQSGVFVRPGTRHGTFGDEITTPTALPERLVTARDFNHDGNLDLLATDMLMDNSNPFQAFSTAGVLLGNGDGTFRSPIPFVLPVGQSAGALDVADLNKDGELDVAVAGSISTVTFVDGWPSATYSTYLNVALGNGDGSFRYLTRANVQKNSYYSVTDVALGDFTGDARLDALTIFGDTLFLHVGKSNGGLGGPKVVATTAYSGTPDLCTADFNRDGRLDFAATGTVFLGNGRGQFTRSHSDSVIRHATVGDFNRDGYLDLATSGFSVLLGNGDGTFRAAVTYIAGTAGAPAVGDFDGNGWLDVALSPANTDAGVTVLLNDHHW
jgi:FG-GAP-like repeat